MSVTRFSTGAIREDMLATNTSFAASDMEWISTIRVGSGGVASVTFSNIPQEYKHLQIRGIVRSMQSSAYSNGALTFNGDTAANYSQHQLVGDGSTASSASSVSGTSMFMFRAPGTTATANTFDAFTLDLLDYANTLKYKTFRCLEGFDVNGSGFAELFSGSWRSTAAVSSLTFSLGAQTISQFSKFALYGIRG